MIKFYITIGRFLPVLLPASVAKVCTLIPLGKNSNGRGGEGREREERVAPPIGNSGYGSGGRKGKEKGTEGSLGWGVQALLFSTLSTGRQPLATG